MSSLRFLDLSLALDSKEDIPISLRKRRGEVARVTIDGWKMRRVVQKYRFHDSTSSVYYQGPVPVSRVLLLSPSPNGKHKGFQHTTTTFSLIVEFLVNFDSSLYEIHQNIKCFDVFPHNNKSAHWLVIWLLPIS